MTEQERKKIFAEAAAHLMDAAKSIAQLAGAHSAKVGVELIPSNDRFERYTNQMAEQLEANLLRDTDATLFLKTDLSGGGVSRSFAVPDDLLYIRIMSDPTVEDREAQLERELAEIRKAKVEKNNGGGTDDDR